MRKTIVVVVFVQDVQDLESWNGNIVLLLLSCQDCLCLLDGFIEICI